MNHNNQHGPAGGDKSPVIAQKALLESASIDMEALDGESRPLPAKLLTSREMNSLTAISDTFLPSMDVPAGPYSESMEALYRTSASMLGVPQKLGEYIKSGKLQHLELLPLLRLSLWLLSTWYGTFFLCGTRSMSRQFPYFHKFSDLDHRQREEIILGWSVSFFSLYRQLFRGLKFLIALLYFTQVNETNSNPTWQALGYCGPDPNLVNAVKNDEEQAPLRRSLIYIENSRDTLCATIAQAGLTTTSRPYAGLHKPILTIQCDAVVVGSGSGGGLVAGVLAQAGYKVIVLEKGDYHARNSLTLLEGSSLDHMYEASGMLPTSDTNVVILAGSTVGGGSAINWSASIRTPDHVIREWRHELGLDLFGSDAYENAMDAVCARMGVQADFTDENLNNAVLRRGCQELGYPVCNIPRNSPPDHHCGWCCFGCPDGRKQGTHETWLVDMPESGNGVILPGGRATKVLYINKGRRRRHVANGVVFEYANGWSGEKEICMVESKVTIVACGALRTPVLLKQSGLKNPNIGKHLHLHPVAMVWGHFPDSFEGKTSYEGGIMTAMSPVVSNSGYGALIQTPALHPGLFSSLMPWVSGADFKDRMTRFSRTAHVFALARDRGEGTVSSCGAIGYKMGEG